MMHLYTFPNTPSIDALALTTGVFDGVHRGHCAVLNALLRAAQVHHLPTCVVTYDPHPRSVVEGVPVPLLSSPHEKQQRMAAMGIDFFVVIPFTQSLANTSFEDFFQRYLVRELHATQLVVGFDHYMGKTRAADFEQITLAGHACNVAVTVVGQHSQDDEKISSSAIRRALIGGDVNAANAMLGYRYSFDGTVVEGVQAGRAIGFPTANLQLECAQKLLPKAGAYAVRVKVGEREYDGMFNIGTRATLNHANAPTLEAHLFDFADNIYGQLITVTFVAHLRDEQQFLSLNHLQHQLTLDAAQARVELKKFEDLKI
jgi:riboflavin kinase/FMN adenylyltransferase